MPRGIFLEGNLPTGIHWINYWSDEIVHTVGMERIYKAINAYPNIVFKNGILLIKDTALDINKEEDMAAAYDGDGNRVCQVFWR